ncbi:hypothetical protein LXL04_023467 [Taraxacum kok-saghyz]
MLMARFPSSTLAQPPIPFQIAIDSYKSIHIKSDRFTLLELQLHRRPLPSLFLIFSIFSLPLNPWNGGNKIGLRKMDTELCGKGESRLPPDFDTVDERLQREGESAGSDWTTPSPSSRSHPPSPPSEKNQNGGNLVFLQNSTHYMFPIYNQITAFSDRHAEFEKLNTEILGVSVDNQRTISPPSYLKQTLAVNFSIARWNF